MGRVRPPGEHARNGLSDAPPEHFQPAGGLYVSIHVEEPAEADRIYNALAEGGTVQMPIDKTFWAERFGMLVDRFGTPWMVNCDLKQESGLLGS